MAERVSRFELIQDYRELNELFDRLAAFKTKHEYKRSSKVSIYHLKYALESILDERDRVGKLLDAMEEDEEDSRNKRTL